MKKNIIDKIKQVMFYEMGKTLTENKIMSNITEESDVEIDEQGGSVKDLVAVGKVGKDLKAGLDDLARFAIADNKAILVRDAKGALVPAQTGDEIIKAIKKGAISAEELAKVNFGLFKSAGTSENTLRLLATDIVESPKFMKEYMKIWDPKKREEFKNVLKGRGYSESGTEALISKIESNNLWKEIKSGKSNVGKVKSDLKAANAKNKQLEAIIAKDPKTVESATGELRTVVNNNVTVGNVSQGASAGVHAEAQAIKEIAPEAKVVASESKAVVETMKPSKWQKFKAIAGKLSPKYWIMLGLAGVGGWYLWKFFKGRTTKPEDQLFGKCLDDVIDDDGTTIRNTTGGDPVVQVTKTGNSDYDSKGGLWFYNNGRVFIKDQSKRGRWSCKGTQTVVAEQDGNPNTGIGNINIAWDGEAAPVDNGGGSGSGGSGSGGSGSSNPNYHDCSSKDFPLEFGCVSPKIAEIQKCLGITPQKGNFGPKTKKGLEDLQYNLSGGITKEIYDKIKSACNPTTGSTATVTGSTTGSTATVTGSTTGNTTTAPITPPAVPAEPVFDRNRLQELIASKNLVKKRKGVIVKWVGPELEGNDYYILDKYLIDKGYIQKKQRETGDRDDEDVTMKYKWKLQGEE